MLSVALSTFFLGEAQSAPITTAALAPRLQGDLIDLRSSGDSRRLAMGEAEYAIGAAGTAECDSGSWKNVMCGATELENACDAFPGFHRMTKGVSKAECEAAQAWLEANGELPAGTNNGQYAPVGQVTDFYDGLFPGGCNLGKQSWYPASDQDTVHYNSQLHGGQGREQWGGSSARSDPMWRPICKKTAAPPADDGKVYTVGKIGIFGCAPTLSGNCPELLNACPTGYTRMDKDSTDKAQCEAALSWLQANDAETIYLWNVNAPQYHPVASSQTDVFDMALGGVHGLPGGCLMAGGEVSFNSETSGVSHGSYRPVCMKEAATPQTCEDKLDLIRAILA